jgi:hypothetical protein
MLDTKNGNRPVSLNVAEINRANAEEPGRYIPAGPSIPALTQTGLIEDIRGGVQQVRNNLSQMTDADFNLLERSKIAVALRSRDPRSAMEPIINAAAAQHLSGPLQEYLINLLNLKENAMAMRAVLKAGQGSEDMRDAITAVIPGPMTISRQYGLKQLDTFERTLNRVERGVPKVPLRTDIPGAGEGGGGGTFSVTDPHGGVHTFKTQAEADAFKKAAGIK